MDNLGTISAWVGIGAFILAIPISILANILTPKIQAWWAKRSSLSRSKRIELLKYQMAAYEGGHSVEFRLESLTRGIYEMFAAAVSIAGSIFPYLIGILWSNMLPESKEAYAYLHAHKIVVLGVYVFAFMWISLLYFLVIRGITRMRSSLNFIMLASSTLSQRKLKSLQAEIATLVDNS